MNQAKKAIKVRNLSRTYLVSQRESGLMAALKSVFNRNTEEVHAVKEISFDINQGGTVGFLGPNGAGKTTTLKMLAGLLYPTSGSVEVLGHSPTQRKSDFLRQISLVMGRRNQLIWDIPAADSFLLNQTIYEIPETQFQQNKKELVGLLELDNIITKPVRNLSLGERMKCELVGALLHEPKLLLLDEPTIGLDLITQRKIRDFLKIYNEKTGATILLTSHYMADVEALCDDVIIINQGKIIYNGALNNLVNRYAPYRQIEVKVDPTFTNKYDGSQFGDLIEQREDGLSLRVPADEVAKHTAHLFSKLPIIDVNIHDVPLEEIIEQAFTVEME